MITKSDDSVSSFPGKVAGVAAAAIILSTSIGFAGVASADVLKAKVVLRGAPGVEGVVVLEQDGDATTVLTVEVSGLAPGRLTSSASSLQL